MSAIPQAFPEQRKKPVKRLRPRLSGATVAEIRKLYREAQENGENLGYGQLARMFKTGRSTIRDICRNKTHVQNLNTGVSASAQVDPQEGA